MRASYTKAETTAMVAVIFVVLLWSGTINSASDWLCVSVFTCGYLWWLHPKEAK